MLSTLLSTRIKADIAVAAARELNRYGTPRRMLDASWQDRVDALGRAHYVRYDESTATAHGDGARLLLDEYEGDLRTIRRSWRSRCAGDDLPRLSAALVRVSLDRELADAVRAA